MIAVIADDFTGAAEIGGLALRYNMKVEITSDLDVSSNADLLVIATDTRSMTEANAKQTMEKVCDMLLQIKPRFIFKKIDSVLRGHILAEISIEKKKLGCDRVLIIPANPGMGRTIVEGQYLLKKKPIHLSDFSHDPEFPILSSNVADMLRAAKGVVKQKSQPEPLADDDIVVGDVKESADLEAWSKMITKNTLVAGGAEFFNAVLHHVGYNNNKEQQEETGLQLPALMVLGSAYHKEKDDEASDIDRDNVCTIPKNILDDEWRESQARKDWIGRIVDLLNTDGRTVIAGDANNDFSDPLKLRTRIADACLEISKLVTIKEWLIEGGSTAASILHKLGIHNLYPLQELAPGVIRMETSKDQQQHFTLKPGSYDWPASILSHIKHQTAHA
jgi:uncharacterized protein YgbK (DUF1537 family)